MSNDRKFDRRAFIRGLGAGAIAASPFVRHAVAAADPSSAFQHGVASGDPLADRVIIWTRVSQGPGTVVPVFWDVALDAGFRQMLRRGRMLAQAASDYTVKIDVLGLPANTKLYYRFRTGRQESPTGITRTLPIGSVTSVKMAVFSCSNFPAGYFNAYADAALQDVDVALHIGDYIYEYGAGGYASQDALALGRVSTPATELLSLADYRERYAQYRGDADLQAAHAAFPWICVWDDHEFTNDTWKAGAQNHQANEGDFFVRRAAALQAYYEWMPIRAVEPARPLRIFRSFTFGNLVDLHMLDTRAIGRDLQLSYPSYFGPTGFNTAAFSADLTQPGRQLLGAEQTQWLAGRLASTSATWTVLGQQVLMGRMNIPAPVVLQQISFSAYSALLFKAGTAPATLTPGEIAILAQPAIPYNLDAWDGYFVARETVLGAARATNKNLVVLSGDTHNAWASDLVDVQGRPVGVEFATPGISSPGLEEFFPAEPPTAVAAGLEQLIGPLVYAETASRGYMLVTATPGECRATWRYVSTVKSPTYTASTGKELRVLPGAGNRRLVPV